MTHTLYQKLTCAETLNSKIRSNIDDFKEIMRPFEDLPGFLPISINEIPTIDIFETQRSLLRNYEDNPIFYDAIHGKQSLSESLEELAEVNKGVRKFLPRRRNKAHNERIGQLGELISRPNQLKAYGILALDNIVSMAVVLSTITFGAAYLLNSFLSPESSATVDPEKQVYLNKVIEFYMPAITLALTIPLFGFDAYKKRSETLPFDQAKYLDGKIKLFY